MSLFFEYKTLQSKYLDGLHIIMYGFCITTIVKQWLHTYDAYDWTVNFLTIIK